MIKQSAGNVKQPGQSESGGLEYNEIFNKIVSSYKNENSARAALSRALKNLESFGMVKAEGSHVLITGKGIASINIEMKDKLILRLNEVMKKPLNDLEEAVRLLLMLSQRGAQDIDLLKNAKENSSFTISDFEALRKKISERKEFLTRMDALIEKQIEKLRELNFNDFFESIVDDLFISKILELVKDSVVTIESDEKGFVETLPANWKKPSAISAEGKEFASFFPLLQKFPSSKVTIYFSAIKIIFSGGKAFCYGSHSDIAKIRAVQNPPKQVVQEQPAK
jgi:hypothetical protein